MKKIELDIRPGDIIYLPPKDILTAEDLSARWGGEVKPDSLKNWRTMKIGPKYVKLGKGANCRIVYRLSAVEKYEREHEITPKVKK